MLRSVLLRPAASWKLGRAIPVRYWMEYEVFHIVNLILPLENTNNKES